MRVDRRTLFRALLVAPALALIGKPVAGGMIWSGWVEMRAAVHWLECTRVFPPARLPLPANHGMAHLRDADAYLLTPKIFCGANSGDTIR